MFRPVLFALLLPGAALAQESCASRADLSRGIAVLYAHGGTDVFTADPRIPGAVRWTAEYQGANLGTTVLAQGYIYLSAIGPNGQEVRYDYGILPAELPLPEPGESWEWVATVTAADGTSSTERQSHAYGAEGTLTMGDCLWQLISVTITYPLGTEEIYFFPDLGLSVRAGDEMTAILPLDRVP